MAEKLWAVEQTVEYWAEMPAVRIVGPLIEPPCALPGKGETIRIVGTQQPLNYRVANVQHTFTLDFPAQVVKHHIFFFLTRFGAEPQKDQVPA